MRVILELLRIIFIFIILGTLAWELIKNIYTINEVTERYQVFAVIGIFLLLFVLYRNKLQFSGWYQGNKRVKLTTLHTKIIICCSVLLIIFPLFLSIVMN
ncbi:glucose dehydrogenase [Salirhabdus euzebyi]|uniref:Glucose dehydrogenase n=1 Tax=Salirhabdus euzebyi TaxID=394506 RepID=A0A841Q250_9BACI|nr:glucose dehydrogenase [Salirhabdus euzebyi]